MPYVYAGEWGVEAITQGITVSGSNNILQALPGTAVTVRDITNTFISTLYTDRTKGTQKPNPTTTDSLGNLSIFADPGSYQVTVGTNAPFKIDISLDAAEPIVTIDPRAYGAKVDGSTDDRAAYLAAITAATGTPGGQILVPPGVSFFSASIDLTGLHDLAFIAQPSHAQGGPGSIMGTSQLTTNGGAYEVFVVNGQGTTNAYTYRLRFENITFKSGLRCISFQNVVDCTFINCGFFPTSNTGADNVGVRIVNSFLIWFRTCTFNAAAATGKRSVILRGQDPSFDVKSVYLVYFLDCAFWYGGVAYDHASASTPVARHYVFQRCLTENFNTTELFDLSRSGTGTITLSGVDFEDCEQADQTGFVVYAHVHSPNGFSGITFRNCNSAPTIQRDSGATIEGVLLASPRAGTSETGGPYSASGSNPVGNAVTIMGQTGWGVISDATTWTTMNIAPDRGNLLAGALDGDANARFLLNLDGTHRWGTGASAAADVTLGRTGAASLNVTGVNQVFTFDGSTALSLVQLKSTTGSQISMIRAGETFARTLYNESSLQFGPGGAAGPDTKLTRTGINILQLTDGMTLDIGATTGLTIGNATTQKLGYYGVAPVVQQAATQSPRQVLSSTGLMSSTGQLSEPNTAVTAASSTTTSTTYANLADAVSTAVTVTTGTKAKVTVTAALSNTGTGTGNATFAGFAVSGATTIAAADASTVRIDPPAASTFFQMSAVYFVTGLNPGANTFTLQYRVVAGTGTFVNRSIIVEPL